MNRDQWWNAPGIICHYTTAGALLTILGSRKLRLGEFKNSNDPWESEFWVPGTTDGGRPGDGFDGARHIAQIDESKRNINRISFANDEILNVRSSGHEVSDRGFGSFPMWTHYADKFSGACLLLDRDQLLREAKEQLGPSSVFVDGRNISYEGHISAPSSRVDQSGHEYIDSNIASLLFRKHKQWAYENEFRLASIARSPGYQFIECRKALVGVVVGKKSPLNYINLHAAFEINVLCQQIQSGRQWVWQPH